MNENRTGRRWLERLCVVFVSLVVARSFGLNYGEQNQNTYLVDGLVKLRPDFLAGDWFARETIQYHGNFRFIVVFADFLGSIPWTLALFNVLLIWGGMLLIYGILRTLDRKYSLFTFSLMMILVILDETESFSGSYIFSSYLQPSSIAGLFTIAAIYFFLRGSHLCSGTALGLAGFFHANYLLLGFPFFGVAHLLLGREKLASRLLKQFGLSLVLLIPELPLLLNFTSSENAERARYIYQQIRSPHHYVPTASPAQFIPFVAWNVMALVGIPYLQSEPTRRKRLVILWSSFLGLTALPAVLLSVVFIPFVSQLYFSRYAPFSVMTAQAIFFLGISASCFSENAISVRRAYLRTIVVLVGLCSLCLYEFHYKPSHTHAVLLVSFVLYTALLSTYRLVFCGPAGLIDSRRRILLISSAFLLIFGMISVSRQAYWRSTLLNGFPGETENGLYEWAKTTEKETTFLIPPDLQNFRLRAERAVVIDWKSIPADPDGVVEWYRRICDVSGNDECKTPEEAERGYSSMSLDRLNRLTDKYGVDFAVFHKPADVQRLRREPAFENDGFVVLSLGKSRNALGDGK